MMIVNPLPTFYLRHMKLFLPYDYTDRPPIKQVVLGKVLEIVAYARQKTGVRIKNVFACKLASLQAIQLILN